MPQNRETQHCFATQSAECEYFFKREEKPCYPIVLLEKANNSCRENGIFSVIAEKIFHKLHKKGRA